MIKVIILDWNGTLTRDLFEIRFFDGLLKKILKKEFLNLFLWLKVRRLKDLANSLSGINQLGANKINSTLPLLVENFNSVIQRRIKLNDLYEYVLQHANDSSSMIDKELVKTIDRLRAKYRIIVGIISSGYRLNIEKTLGRLGFYVDFIEANDFCISPEGHLYYDLHILDNKDIIFMKIIQKMNLKFEEVAYIGDDLSDMKCFKKAGYPIVSLLAEHNQVELLKQELNLFCPRELNEMARYLEDHMKENFHGQSRNTD